ncbi:MAG: DUF1847 domain-containing protein [Angelakisella sp.]|nr:DUF1847 domain-containing protein [Angelakisella sp.]
MYTCASCTILACSEKSPERLPKNCPMHQQNLMKKSFDTYFAEENHVFYIQASSIEGIGYGQWVRLKETMELCRRMGYKHIGLAFCRGLKKEAKIIDTILRNNGFEVVSVICKTGGIPKEDVGISKEHKVHAEKFEPMCNPIAQANLLNSQNTEFNIAVGLCVGHDSLFYKYSKALVTTLIAKDRVLAHNPAGALYCAEGYFKEKLKL